MYFDLGPKHRLRFLCEVRVSGMPYVGAGNSTNKKDAEKNAARDFVNFLVRTGSLNANEVPANALEQGGALPARAAPIESVPVFQVRKLSFASHSREFILFFSFFFVHSPDKGLRMLVKPIEE